MEATTNAHHQLKLLLLEPSEQPLAFKRDHSFSRTQFQHHVAQSVSNLRQQPHQRYLLHIEDSYEFAVNFFALLLLGKDIVLSANNKPHWLKSIASSFDAAISDRQIIDSHIAENQIVENQISESKYEQFAPKHYHNAINQEPLQLPNHFTSKITFFTSGSSSEPKAITKLLEQLLLEVDALERLFAHSVEQCTFIASVSHHHIYGLIFRLLWPLIYQRVFAAEMILYPEQLLDINKTQSKLCLISSPAFLSRQDQKLEKVSLGQCFSSGSLLSGTAAQSSYHQLGCFPIEVFGSTETGGIGYRSQDNHNDLWTLFPNIRLSFNSDDQAALHSPYINHTQSLDDHLEMVSEQQFRLLGRMDRVVKIEEKRVSLDAIEGALKRSDFIAEAKVVLLQQHRTFLGAVVQLSDTGQEFLAANAKNQLNQVLRRQLATQFENVAIPRKWRYLEQLPYNAQGKLPLTTLTAFF